MMVPPSIGSTVTEYSPLSVFSSTNYLLIRMRRLFSYLKRFLEKASPDDLSLSEMLQTDLLRNHISVCLLLIPTHRCGSYLRCYGEKGQSLKEFFHTSM
jgi:hypothetical protein